MTPLQPLFVYGTLLPLDFDETRCSGTTSDAVRGRLYDLGPYPGLVDLDDPTAPWVEGFVRMARQGLLEGAIDDHEGVAQGLYRRVATKARSGRRVWVYVYGRPLPEGARGPLTRWDGRRGAWDALFLEAPLE